MINIFFIAKGLRHFVPQDLPIVFAKAMNGYLDGAFRHAESLARLCIGSGSRAARQVGPRA